MVGIVEAGGDKISRRKYRPNSVTFSDNEEIINPGILYCVCVCVVYWYIIQGSAQDYFSGGLQENSPRNNARVNAHARN